MEVCKGFSNWLIMPILWHIFCYFYQNRSQLKFLTVIDRFIVSLYGRPSSMMSVGDRTLGRKDTMTDWTLGRRTVGRVDSGTEDSRTDGH